MFTFEKLSQGKPSFMRRLGFFELAASCAILLAACLQTTGPETSPRQSKIADGGLLSGDPCAAPCFWDIRPGVATKQIAIQSIHSHGVTGYEQRGNFVVYPGSITFQYDASDVVQTVEFHPDSVITVQALVAAHGPPNSVEVLYDTSSTVEHNYFEAGLFYDSLHTYVRLRRQEIFPAYSLSPETLVAAVDYFSEGSYGDRKTSSRHVTQWIGYGAYIDPSSSPSP